MLRVLNLVTAFCGVLISVVFVVMQAVHEAAIGGHMPVVKWLIEEMKVCSARSSILVSTADLVRM
jgi:hypothetical protein